MYLEFPLPNGAMIRELGIDSLKRELEIWASQHNIDYHSLRYEYRKGHYKELVRLPSDRAYELFCISWCPRNPYFRDYSLHKE